MKTRKTILILIILMVVYNLLNGQTVHIPDANFKAILLADTLINTNGDQEIQLSEAESYSGPINCSFNNISSLIGLGAFTGITTLDCSGNLLTSLDVSLLPHLVDLRCFDNQLSSLDVSAQDNLVQLLVGENEISSLDLSSNGLLKTLNCNSNPLGTLDLSHNPNLEILNCGNTRLNDLDVSHNPRLTYLDCSFNDLETLDVRHNQELSELDCQENSLSALDVSQNPDLEDLYCSGNQLSELNVANGRNRNNYELKAYDNPDLYCIQVDDEEYSRQNWPGGWKDEQARYDENCSTVIEHGEIETRRVDHNLLSVYPNPADNFIQIDNLKTNATVSVIDITSRPVVHRQTAGHREKIDLSTVTPGMYFVRIGYEEEGEVFKVVVR